MSGTCRLIRSPLPSVAALVGILAGCSPQPRHDALACQGLGTPAQVFTLYFGRSIPGGGAVSDTDWRRFQDQVVAPNLPDGFTVFDASGAWMSPTGHVTRHEATKVLIVALPEHPGAAQPVQRIRQAYQQRFQQQLVGMTVQSGCAAF